MSKRLQNVWASTQHRVLYSDCLVVLQGGLIAFPAQAVRTMKVMQRLPDKLMLKAIKKAMTEYNSTA